VSEPAGRRRASTGSSRRGGGLFGGSRSKPDKGGKRALRPDDTQPMPAFVEHDVPGTRAPATPSSPVPPPAARPPAPTPPAPAQIAPVTPVTEEAEVPHHPERSRPATRATPHPSQGAQRSQRAGQRQSARPAKPRPPSRAVEVGPVPTSELVLWTIGLVVGFAILILGNGLDLGPHWLGGVGSLIITIAYVWVLVSRTGGRPLIFCAVTLAGGVLTLSLDRPELNTGAAAVVAIVSAVLGVVITVPAVRVLAAFREACLAIVVACGGAVAALGWRPEVDLGRFEYAVLVLALICAFTLVYRLGAGLHGLGRRGVVIVLFGAGVLVLTLLYAEALRHWADVGVTASALDVVDWCREHIGAFPRPLEAVLGVPALTWGTHMRARRRQGWWVCAFGAAGTSAVSISLMNTELGLVEVALSIGYGLVIGLVIGYALIRVDLALTGSGRGRPAVGRRGRRSEEQENAVRPEPKRTGALL
jgi:hypothetical protein